MLFFSQNWFTTFSLTLKQNGLAEKSFTLEYIIEVTFSWAEIQAITIIISAAVCLDFSTFVLGGSERGFSMNHECLFLIAVDCKQSNIFPVICKRK